MSVFDDEQMEFADRYERMADGELLALAAQPWAISDAAWEALEGELERRRIKVPEPESAPQIVVPDKRNLVLLRRFRDLPEALLFPPLIPGCMHQAVIQTERQNVREARHADSFDLPADAFPHSMVGLMYDDNSGYV